MKDSNTTSVTDGPPNASRGASLALGDTKPTEETGISWPWLAGLIAFFVWLLVFPGLPFFLFVLGLIFMIFLHELGHFMTAKWTGMKPTDFFIGFGPTIFSFRRGEVTYGVKALPLGAFVRIVGMNNLDPVEPADIDRAYMHKSFPRRMFVITAGSVMHFIQAIVLFVALTTLFGVSESMGNLAEQTGSVIYDDSLVDQSLKDQREAEFSTWTVGEPLLPEDGAPATATTRDELGLVQGDKIVAVAGDDTNDWRDLITAVRSRPNEEVQFDIVNADGSTRTQLATIGLAPDTTDVGRIGVAPDLELTPYPNQRPGVAAGFEVFGEQMWGAARAMPTFFSPSTLFGLGESVATGTEPADVGEPRPTSIVGAAGIAGILASLDWRIPFYFLGLINVFVGLFNLVPLLPLDGGHAAIATYERIRSTREKRYYVDVAKLLPLTYGVVMVLGFIGITTIILDIRLLAG